MNRLHEIRLIAAYETKGIVRDVTFWIIALVILAGCPLFYMWLTRPEQLEGGVDIHFQFLEYSIRIDANVQFFADAAYPVCRYGIPLAG